MSGASRRTDASSPWPILVEACAVSPAEVSRAFREGAGRVELCRNLDVGGLTPSPTHVARVLVGEDRPVFVMIRPSPGPFRASPAEVAAMTSQVEEMVGMGAAGVVLGVLDRRGRIDLPALKELVAAAAGTPVTFHRAFDQLDDPLGGIELLAQAGVRRVLTSGGCPTAWEGRMVLGKLVDAAGGRIQVLGGGRVRADHAVRLVEETGLKEIHARAEAIPGVVGALRTAASNALRTHPEWKRGADPSQTGG